MPYNVTSYGSQLPNQQQSASETAAGAEQKDDNDNSASCSCTNSKFTASAAAAGAVAAAATTATEPNEFPAFKQDPEFPHSQLASLEDKINNPRWVIPVLPDQELEVLLDAAIELCRTGKSWKTE